MSLEAATAIIFAVGILVTVVSCIVVHEERKARRGLPPPQPDARDWTNVHMRDVKRWTR